MSKKTFRDNPAMHPAMLFLSTEETEKAERATPVTEKKTPAVSTGIPEGYKPNPQYVEKRTRRVQLVFQPSLYEKGKAIAEEKGLSFNEYMLKLLERAISEEN